MTMDDEIRRRAGREPQPSTDEPNAAASDEQRQAATLAGVPAGFAHRINGTGADAVDDARKLAATLDEAGIERPPSTTFDGGARVAVRAPDSIDALIRGAADARRGLA
jgi:hypothetical protein